MTPTKRHAVIDGLTCPGRTTLTIGLMHFPDRHTAGEDVALVTVRIAAPTMVPVMARLGAIGLRRVILALTRAEHMAFAESAAPPHRTAEPRYVPGEPWRRNRFVEPPREDGGRAC